MIVRFFQHGDGSGRSAVDYLMAKEVPEFDKHRNRIKGATVKRDPRPECLSGDPEQMALLIDSDHRKWRYTSLVVAFADDDAPSNDEQREVMASFETAAFAGLAQDQTETLWVRHTHMGNVELHCLVLRKELHNERALNIAPPGAERYFNAWRDYWNAKMGWADPEAVEHHRPLRDVIEGKDRKKLRDHINGLVIGEIEKGTITDHTDVRAYLRTLEEDGLEIKPLTEKQIARRKAKGKARPPDKRITLREIGSTTSAGTFRLEDRICHEQWTAAEYFAGQAAKESLGAGQRKPRATADRVEELRRAMEDAISKRAEKNRERYGGSPSNRATFAQPDESSDRGGTVGARNNDTESGGRLELHTLEDGDAERLLIDVGGLRRSARRLRNFWRNEAGTTSSGDTANSAGSERESGDTRHRRPWDHHSPSTRGRDDGLSDRNTGGTHLYQEAIEEYEDERWSYAVRERIAALRRNFAEADRAIGRTLEAVHRGIEALREQFKRVGSQVVKAELENKTEVLELKRERTIETLDQPTSQGPAL